MHRDEYRAVLCPEGRLIYTNKAALDLIGCKMEDVAGMYPWDTPWHTDAPRSADQMRRMVRAVAKGEGDQCCEMTLELHGRPLTIIQRIRARLNRAGNRLLAILPSSSRASIKPLSYKELEALRWVAMGKTSAEIGTILGISRRTVEYHLINVRRKLDAVNVMQSVAIAVRSGLISFFGFVNLLVYDAELFLL